MFLNSSEMAAVKPWQYFGEWEFLLFCNSTITLGKLKLIKGESSLFFSDVETKILVYLKVAMSGVRFDGV